MEALRQRRDALRRIFDEIEARRGFECTECGRVYCADCIVRYAPDHAGGGKACEACGARFQAL